MTNNKHTIGNLKVQIDWEEPLELARALREELKELSEATAQMRKDSEERMRDLRRKIRSTGELPAFKSGFKASTQDEVSDENKAVEGSDLVGENGPTLVDLPRGKSAGEVEVIKRALSQFIDLAPAIAAARRHAFNEHVKAGFTEQQALMLCLHPSPAG